MSSQKEVVSLTIIEPSNFADFFSKFYKVWWWFYSLLVNFHLAS